MSLDCNSGAPDSPNSPPTRGSPTSAPIQEENEDPQYNGANRDLQLFSSPSMPNISLGRPHLSNVAAAAAAANHFVSYKYLINQWKVYIFLIIYLSFILSIFHDCLNCRH